MLNLEPIWKRTRAATPGRWYWREGTHTADPKTSDAGGLHTMTTSPLQMPNGQFVEDDNVIYPIGKVTGNPFWLKKFGEDCARGKGIAVALECFGREEDKEFIAHAREDIPVLLIEVERLRKEIEGLKSVLALAKIEG